MYVKSKWASLDQNVLIVKKYHTLRAMPQSMAIKERRAPKRFASSVAQEDANRRLKHERINRQILDNFRVGDWYMTLTFNTYHVPKTEQEAKAVLEKFKRDLRRLFRKRGRELKYISIIENIRGRGRVHVHMMIPALPRHDITALEELWPHGHINIASYKAKAEDAYRLAKYFVKLDAKETSSPVMTSHNLITTLPQKEIVSRAETYSDVDKPPKGYRVVKNLSYAGYTQGGNPNSGYPYRVTVFERNTDSSERAAPRHGPARRANKKQKSRRKK